MDIGATIAMSDFCLMQGTLVYPVMVIFRQMMDIAIIIYQGSMMAPDIIHSRQVKVAYQLSCRMECIAQASFPKPYIHPVITTQFVHQLIGMMTHLATWI